ncbi:hypothetical protein [Pseudomonas oryzihabitans]|uniref:hypothetical protein n=1 Tax=Pseudomonas oryzihabitans TaxID=47885 RepID=UPI0011104EDC|nr:hypothetical protein [Pseudomonas psychrotolerans]
MPYRRLNLVVLGEKPLEELERDLERQRRKVEASRHWLRYQFNRLAQQQADLEALEALVASRRATVH